MNVFDLQWPPGVGADNKADFPQGHLGSSAVGLAVCPDICIYAELKGRTQQYTTTCLTAGRNPRAYGPRSALASMPSPNMTVRTQVVFVGGAIWPPLGK